MSIFGSMKTAVSGMNAQANRLSVVSDNIANTNTTGYKRATTNFSSLVLPSTSGNYTSGGVTTSVRYAVSTQGDISYTTSSTDLSIQGDGFFIVQDSSGTPYLTRAGDFTVDPDGNLVNSAGYTLMGYSYDSGAPAAVVNGFDGLTAVNVKEYALTATASTAGLLKGNLNSNETAVTTDTPADNTATSTYGQKTSLAAYDSLGNKVLYDFYFTKTADNTWDVSVFKQSDASAGTSSFPYGTSGDAPLDNISLEFDTDGQLLSTSASSVTIPNGTGSMTIDLSGFSQLSSSFSASGSVDGNAPSPIDSVQIGTDGTVYARYEDGSNTPLYRIPLATVSSPDNLTLVTGNVYQQSATSGVIITGFPGTNSFGTVQSGSLEESNVDLATELTEMIEAQRVYTANSKVFQTGSDLMDVLVNLKR